jgi:hypothetical protein
MVLLWRQKYLGRREAFPGADDGYYVMILVLLSNFLTTIKQTATYQPKPRQDIKDVSY